MPHDREEVEAAVAAYVETRRRIEAGDAAWVDLVTFFTDDAIYIDPAWGRVEGIGEIRAFLVDSMLGLEDWRFPVEFSAVDGDNVVIKWTQVLPSGLRQSGISTMVYAGNGRFSYEEDLLNMVHVLDDLKASRWRPNDGFQPPPAQPNRDFSRPAAT